MFAVALGTRAVPRGIFKLYFYCEQKCKALLQRLVLPFAFVKIVLIALRDTAACIVSIRLHEKKRVGNGMICEMTWVAERVARTRKAAL